MYGKAKTGRGAGGLVRYLTDEKAPGLVGYMVGDKHELGAIVYRNLAAETTRDAVREMTAVAKLSRRCRKPVLHMQLSWHPSERPSEEQMIAAMDRMLSRLGLEDHQALYAIHREKAHLHIHAAVNRVGVDGHAWEAWKVGERIRAECRIIEREFGFEPGERYLRDSRQREPTPRQRRIYEHSGREADPTYHERLESARREATTFAKRVADVKALMRDAGSWLDLHRTLGDRGLGVREYVNPKNPRRRGLEIVDLTNGDRCAASDLGSDYGRAALERRLGAFRPGPASERLEALRPVERRSGREESQQEASRRSTGTERPQNAHHRDRAGDSDLWKRYQGDRSARARLRELTMRQQRAHEKARRQALRDLHRRQRDDIRGRGVRGVAWQAVRSELAFEHAKQREILDRTIADERARLYEQVRARTWTEYVVDLAGAGDTEALEQLWRWTKAQRDFSTHARLEQHGPEHQWTPPHARTLKDLRYEIDRNTGTIIYLWQRNNREAFRDAGNVIAMSNRYVERDEMRAALRIAAQKWGGTVRLNGDVAFMQRATEIATELGIEIANDDLRDYQRQVREKQNTRRERENELDRGDDELEL